MNENNDGKLHPYVYKVKYIAKYIRLLGNWKLKSTTQEKL